MQVEQKIWKAKKSWEHHGGAENLRDSQLVFVFGSRAQLQSDERFAEIKAAFPNARIALATTSGEIIDNEVHDDTIVVSALKFDHSEVKAVVENISDASQSYDTGRKLVASLPTKNLRHVFIISDGLLVNGSELIQGITSVVPKEVTVTGGLAGDGAAFEKTLVGLDELPSIGKIIAIGFYGDKLKIGYGSRGGWDSFGPERAVTKSVGNVLFELDNKPALELYKSYLGEKANELPASALLFPLSVRDNNDSEESVVRTILAVNNDDQSMTFAGDIPEGSLARLMKANFDRLVDGASDAATASILSNNEFALLVSCVGRKLLLGQRIDDEVEGVKDILGDSAFITGFYSYGELCPGSFVKDCLLHNQTMTITTFSEV